MRIKYFFLTLLLLLSYTLHAQIKGYSYKRDIQGVNGLWHSIAIPNEMFGKVSPSFSDIRIFGITANNDTIEAPYIIQLSEEKYTQKDIAFNQINESKSNNGYYFTFELPSPVTINQIALDFGQQNFDWRVALEGSHNQQQWFSIIDNYRILAIDNDQTHFQFTKLTLPDSKYRFYRLCIHSDARPMLTSSKILMNERVDGNLIDYKIRSFKAENVKKETVIDIDLGMLVPVNFVSVNVKDVLDYYRPITINYLADSTNTDKGWKFAYYNVESGTINSFEKNEFRFSSTFAKRLRLTIDNNDNKPLTIESVAVKGYKYELKARFAEKANYSIYYGNKSASSPNYDIAVFTDKIPATISALKLGPEQYIGKDEQPKVKPLFQNKLWLWAIMGLIIALLGWFSFKMIKNK